MKQIGFFFITVYFIFSGLTCDTFSKQNNFCLDTVAYCDTYDIVFDGKKLFLNKPLLFVRNNNDEAIYLPLHETLRMLGFNLNYNNSKKIIEIDTEQILPAYNLYKKEYSKVLEYKQLTCDVYLGSTLLSLNQNFIFITDKEYHEIELLYMNAVELLNQIGFTVNIDNENKKVLIISPLNNLHFSARTKPMIFSQGEPFTLNSYLYIPLFDVVHALGHDIKLELAEDDKFYVTIFIRSIKIKIPIDSNIIEFMPPSIDAAFIVKGGRNGSLEIQTSNNAIVDLIGKPYFLNPPFIRNALANTILFKGIVYAEISVFEEIFETNHTSATTIDIIDYFTRNVKGNVEYFEGSGLYLPMHSISEVLLSDGSLVKDNNTGEYITRKEVMDYITEGEFRFRYDILRNKDCLASDLMKFWMEPIAIIGYTKNGYAIASTNESFVIWLMEDKGIIGTNTYEYYEGGFNRPRHMN